MRSRLSAIPFIASLGCPAAFPTAFSAEDIQPEQGFAREVSPAADAVDFMVVAAHPLASEAGYHVLQRGGSAIDAAVTVQLVLNLVEPQSSGIGGGAFIVYRDQQSGDLTTFDGRETAPMSISPDRFLGSDGQPLPWWERITGGGSVGVPGTLRLLEATHQRFGRQPWASLFEPAIALAREGFEVSPRMADSIASAADRGLSQFDATRQYFFTDDDQPLGAGHTLKNPEFADTLSLIARHGADVFYKGEIARDIVDTVNSSRARSISLSDLADYRIIERPAVCAPFRTYRVCGMGPPSSGGLSVGQILGMLSYSQPMRSLDIAGVHRILETHKLAFADRDVYIADSDRVAVPVSGLLDADYLASRAALIDPARSMGRVEAGQPPALFPIRELATDTHPELAGTSHISIVDRYGNALSMTTTIESGFGSRLMTRGFLLNNELTDFSPIAHHEGLEIANRIEPGKRPRSSMAPSIVLDSRDRPVLVIGSPGGSRIIHYVANAILAVLELGMDVQDAVSAPHFGNRNGASELEQGTAFESLRAPLEALGHEVIITDMNSGLHAIFIGADGRLRGGADPRREGVALGD